MSRAESDARRAGERTGRSGPVAEGVARNAFDRCAKADSRTVPMQINQKLEPSTAPCSHSTNLPPRRHWAAGSVSRLRNGTKRNGLEMFCSAIRSNQRNAHNSTAQHTEAAAHPSRRTCAPRERPAEQRAFIVRLRGTGGRAFLPAGALITLLLYYLLTILFIW